MPEPARSGPPAALSAGVDVGAAVTASLAVSPFIMTIDAAIVGAAAGRHTLGGAIARGTAETLRRPWGLMRNPGYWMVASVYAATYATANLIDSVSARREVSPAVHGTTKLLGTTAINTTACIAKDVAFARMYGAAKGGRMPPVTVALFGARDLLTVASAYTDLGSGTRARWRRELHAAAGGGQRAAHCAGCHAGRVRAGAPARAELLQRARVQRRPARSRRRAHGAADHRRVRGAYGAVVRDRRRDELESHAQRTRRAPAPLRG